VGQRVSRVWMEVAAAMEVVVEMEVSVVMAV
jgi:hypothetical protein